MRPLDQLREQLLSKTPDELVDLLCKPDEELRVSQVVDVSSAAEAALLETEFTSGDVLQAKLVRRVIAPLLLEQIGPAGLLDNARIREAVDNGQMLARVKYLYRQMSDMHEKMTEYVAANGPFPPAKRILAFGLGGSAIGVLLAREIIQNQGYSVPLDVHTSYPADFHGIDSETLVVICSYSGNTEETLYAFDCAVQRTKNLLILSRGGELGKLSNNYPFIEIPESDIQQPRESIGYWLSAFLFIVSSLGLAEKEDGTVYRFQWPDVEGIEERLDEIDRVCAGETPFGENPAKQYATHFLYGTKSPGTSSEVDWRRPGVPVVFLDEKDRAAGKRLANQFGETVEHPVLLLVLCEDAHNEIESVATLLLEEKLDTPGRSGSYILISSRPYDSPPGPHEESRAAQRMEATLDTLFTEHDVGYLRIETKGASLLERKLCLLKLLDYTRAYVALLRGTTPLPAVFMHLMKAKTGKIVGAADRDLLRSLMRSRDFPLSQQDALSDETIARVFPARRYTILKRLVDAGYLTSDSGMLDLTEKGRALLG